MLFIEGTSGGVQVLAGLGVQIFSSGGPITILKDNFTASSGTPLSSETSTDRPIGPAPSEVFGASQLQCNGSSQAIGQSLGTSFNDDIYPLGTYSDVSLQVTGNYSNTDLGLIGRYVDVNNYWNLDYDPITALLSLWEEFGGTATQQASTACSATNAPIQLVFSGTSISGSIGSSTVNFTSSQLQTATKVGLEIGVFENSASTSDYFVGPFQVTHP